MNATMNTNLVSPLAGMTAQALLHKYFPVMCIVLTALFGCVVGWVATVILGIWLTSPVQTLTAGPPADQATEQKMPLSAYQVILDRNIFNATGATGLLGSDSASAPVFLSSLEKKQIKSAVVAKNFTLIGTIAAGLKSLAVLQEGRKTHIYRLGDKIADGISVKQISRNTVVLVFRDGSRQTLTITGDQAELAAVPVPPQSSSANQAGIKQVGKNKWVIPRDVAAQARGNFNELFKQARMAPRIVAGQADGFVIRMIRPNSFLAQLGLLRGDVVMGINHVQLNSPEKALEIFQQLREARNIKVDLLRNNKPLTLEFEIN